MLLSRNRSYPVRRGRRRRCEGPPGGGAALALAAAALCLARGAGGDPDPAIDTPKVVLVRMATCCAETACAGVEALLVEELSSTALDFDAVDGPPGGASPLDGSLGARRGVALRVSRAPGGGACVLGLWARGRGEGETARREIPLAAQGGPDGEVNAAIEAAEAVYAVLLEMKLVAAEALRRGWEPPPAPVPEPPPAGPEEAADAGAAPEPSAVARVEPEPLPNEPAQAGGRFGVGAGAALVWSPGGVDPMGAVRLSFDGRPLAWLTLRADAWITVAGRDIERSYAKATFDAAAFRLAGLYEFVRRGWFRPALGIAAGGLVVWTNGTGADGYAGGRETALAGYAGGAGRLGFVLTRWLRAEIGLAAGAVMPEARVVFAGETVAGFGRPALDAFAQLELSF